ncbi:hypothetical protein ACQKKK_09500 [Peribacillus sp. NPDC006672]|uniref:hypothetical protein n=1 Tax=Peribacillus sp. NPDC006672 TaxID=3390606 RepID=UPI003D083C04
MYRKEEFPSVFILELMSKDLGLVIAETDCLETILSLAEVANTTYRSAKENGKTK